MLPWPGPVTTNSGTLTRMPSKRSSESTALSALSTLASISSGSGSGLSVLSTVVVAKVSSVADNWLASEDGVNSAAVPRTCTRLTTCASAGAPALVVNTTPPSAVSGSASSPLQSGIARCRERGGSYGESQVGAG